ncbi:MAG: DUF4250 domain-containing protein [Lachnospiraceae bacterium]|nr:DUF4250 domain-containing protein [Lachnospiraceae bacterium]
MNLPKDPVILLSYINTQLRDNYASLSEFCSANGCSPEDIIRSLEAIDYHYNSDTNQFC